MNTTRNCSQSSPPRQSLLIQMSGAPGSGKSSIAGLLGRSINGLVIDHDTIRSSLLEDNDILSFDKTAQIAYRLQWAIAEDMVKQGSNVIIDSTCNFQAIIDQGSALAHKYGFTYWYVECKVDDIAFLDARLRTRDSKKSQRTSVDRPPIAASVSRQGEDSRALFRKWIESPCRPEQNVIIVDSKRSLEELHDHILEQIEPSPNLRWTNE